MKFEDGIYMDSTAFGAEDVLAETIGDLIDNLVVEHDGKKAFSCVLPTGHVGEMSYAEFGMHSDAVACYLRENLGCQKGDVVALMAPNILSYAVVAFGVLKAGLKLTNINPMYTAEEANHQLNDSGAKLMFVVDVFGDKLGEATAGSGVEKIIKLSLLDHFPSMISKILGFALKYVKKVIPAPTRPFDIDYSTVIKDGSAALKTLLASGGKTADYRKGQTADNSAIFQYTGGTTGRSKGAELTHGNIVGNISQTNKRNVSVLEEGNHTLLLVLPLYHVYALAVGCISSLKSGTHVVLMPVPRPMSNLKYAFDKFDITVFPAVNTLYLALLHEDWFVNNPPKSLQYCFSGAAPLQPAVFDRWEELTGCGIYEGYGLTEGTCVVASMDISKPPVKGCVGTLIPGTKARIVHDGKNMPVGEAGELWLSGPQVMKGYLNRPEANEEAMEDGWFKTGDVAKFDEEGHLFIVDRIKDMVIVSGFNVYPTNVEATLTKCETVLDAAVVGVPDAQTGERLIAYVIPKDSSVTEQAVIDECRIHLTGYKVPKTIRFIDEMPKSPVGKVLRKDLRQRALEEEV